MLRFDSIKFRIKKAFSVKVDRSHILKLSVLQFIMNLDSFLLWKNCLTKCFFE